MSVKLYSYWRSSAAWRVRIALHLKGIEFETIPVHLLKDGGQQHTSEYRKVNPQGMVPTLEHDGQVITQSLAIMEYLDECWPEPPLIFGSALEKARIRQLALAAAADIHPLNNLRVLKYIVKELGADDEAKTTWYHHWLKEGFGPLEGIVDEHGPYCVGRQASLADACLIPQLYNARRFAFDLEPYPRLRRIESACQELEAFQKASAENQPDAE